MPNYIYSGVNDKGKNVTGTIDAENEKAARAKLRRTRIFFSYPTQLSLSLADTRGTNQKSGRVYPTPGDFGACQGFEWGSISAAQPAANDRG